MGLFQSLFGRESKESKEEAKATIPWIPLTGLTQLEEIEEKSKSRSQFIFKHSTSCGISRMVLKMFTDNYHLSEDQADLYYLDLHQFREVSSRIAHKFGVHHQSPQLIGIKDGAVVVHRSHGGIPDLDLSKFI